MKFGWHWWFKSSSSHLDADTVEREQKMRFNALVNADPDAVVRAITSWNCGTLGLMARIIEEFELRDDKMRSCSKKLRASVARCDYSILKREGFENDPRAELHAKILRRFWSGIRVTSRFKLDEVGGFTLLMKQMMEAESYGFAVHELVWTRLSTGELSLQFIKIPLWHFENRTGKLRFLPTTNTYDGIDMKPGEWMVSTGDAIGIAASICATLKRCTLADWAVFCERCGMPFFIAKTGAQYKSEAWKNLSKALAAIGRDARIQVDRATDINAIQTNTGNEPYSDLVEWADRAISTLYRGADLSTMSKGGQAVGAFPQIDEMGILETDACQRMSETLHEQIDKFVIRYMTGDEEPYAMIWVEPVKKPNVSTDIEIDRHLIKAGVKLSKLDALQRYGRREVADGGDEPLRDEKILQEVAKNG